MRISFVRTGANAVWTTNVRHRSVQSLSPVWGQRLYRSRLRGVRRLRGLMALRGLMGLTGLRGLMGMRHLMFPNTFPSSLNICEGRNTQSCLPILVISFYVFFLTWMRHLKIPNTSPSSLNICEGRNTQSCLPFLFLCFFIFELDQISVFPAIAE